MKSLELKEKVKQLVADSKLSESIELLLEYSSNTSFLLLAGKMKRVERDLNLGLITREEYYVHSNILAKSIIEISEDVLTKDENLTAHKGRKKILLFLALILSFLFPEKIKKILLIVSGLVVAIISLVLVNNNIADNGTRNDESGIIIDTVHRYNIIDTIIQYDTIKQAQKDVVEFPDTKNRSNNEFNSSEVKDSTASQSKSGISDNYDKKEEFAEEEEPVSRSKFPPLKFDYESQITRTESAELGKKIEIIVELTGFRSEVEIEFYLKKKYKLPFKKVDNKLYVVSLVSSDKELLLSIYDPEAEKYIEENVKGNGSYRWKVKRRIASNASIGIESQN